MEKLKFKDFTFPENPETMSIQFVRPVLFERKTDGTVEFYGLGPGCRTLTGSGAFFGPLAYTRFITLSNMVYDSSPGTLELPILQDWSAYLTQVEATQTPTENYVAYRFTFREADAKGRVMNPSERVLIEKA